MHRFLIALGMLCLFTPLGAEESAGGRTSTAEALLGLGKNADLATCANDYRVSSGCDLGGVAEPSEAADPCSNGGACSRLVESSCGSCVELAEWEAGSRCKFQCCGATPKIVDCSSPAE